MGKEFLVLEAAREAYGLEQIERTMTIGELIMFLKGYDRDMLVCVSNDHGYTYGAVRIGRFRTEDAEDEE